MQVLIQLNEF